MSGDPSVDSANRGLDGGDNGDDGGSNKRARVDHDIARPVGTSDPARLMGDPTMLPSLACPCPGTNPLVKMGDSHPRLGREQVEGKLLDQRILITMLKEVGPPMMVIVKGLV